MIETYIHTPEGEFKTTDPFRQVGTRGIYTVNTNYGWIVTENCLSVKAGHRQQTVQFVDFRSKNRLLISLDRVSEEYLRITTKDDKEYFEPEKGWND